MLNFLADGQSLIDHKVIKTEFVENKGQWVRNVLFEQRQGYNLMQVTSGGLSYISYHPDDMAKLSRDAHKSIRNRFNPYLVRGHRLDVQFINALPNKVVMGTAPLSHYYNFYLGSNSSNWQGGVKAFEKVQINRLYKGIDMVIYGSNRNTIKYDFVVKPYANPNEIIWQYAGAESIKKIGGLLQINASFHTLTEARPFAYQIINGHQVAVSCEYRIIENSKVGFTLGSYRNDLPLVIDPELIFSTYSGSTADNFGAAATYDFEGNLYTAGITNSFTGAYPVTPGAFQVQFGGGTGTWPQRAHPCDITISKYNNDGTRLLYATYLGGDNQDYVHSLVTDKFNHLVVLGSTLSRDYPTSQNAFDRTHNDSFDIVLTKLNDSGTALIGSTFIGGSHSDGLSLADTLCMNYMDQMRGEVQIDLNGDIVVGSVTNSFNFPTSVNAFQKNKSGVQDGCLFKFDSTLSTLRWSSFLGDTLNETLNSIEVMPNGTLFAVGGTHSKNKPASTGVIGNAYYGGISDGWIARVSANGANLERFMYWGSAGYDQCYFIKSNTNGDIYVYGQNFDTIAPTAGAYRTPRGTIFISSFNYDLNALRFSASLGNNVSNNALSPSAFMIDLCGNIYASLYGGSSINARAGLSQSSTTSLPLTSDAIQPATDGEDFYLFVLKPNADSLLYATYFGENAEDDHVDGGTSRFDRRGIVYQSVCASCSKGPNGAFPTTANSYAPRNLSVRCSNVGLKIDFRKNNAVIADFAVQPRNSCGDTLFRFTSKSYNAKYYLWYLNGVLRSTDSAYTDTIRAQGIYTMKLVVIDSSRCIIVDSISKTIEKGSLSDANFTFKIDSCEPRVVFTNLSATQNPTPVPLLWLFGDGDTSHTTNPAHIYTDTGWFDAKLIVNVGSACADTMLQKIYIDNKFSIKVGFTPNDTLWCEFTTIPLRYTGVNGTRFRWYLNDSLFSSSKDTDLLLNDKGIYNIKLVVTDSTVRCNKADSLQKTFQLFPEVYPNYTWERDSCSFSVQFINTSPVLPGDSIGFKWLFGDGTDSFEESPKHRFPSGGDFNVQLISNPAAKCPYQITKTVSLDTLPSILKANFTLTPQPICLPAFVTIKNASVNGIKQWWYVNNILKDSTSNEIKDTFTTAQLFSVRLVVFDTSTCFPYDTLTNIYTVNPAAKADFEVLRDTCSPNLIFINKSVSANPADIITYLWDFGNGDTSTAETPAYTYNQNGTYTITLITLPGTPCADTATQVITYNNTTHLLGASFNLNDSVFCLPAIIKATNTSTNPKKPRWYLNGMMVSDSLNFTDTLNAEGIYKLTLITSDSAACAKADTFSRNIMVGERVAIAFELARDSCSLEARFVNKSAASPNTTFTWYFGDGDSSNLRNPTHTYKQSNTYTVTLVSNAGKICADTMIKAFFIDGDSAMEVKIPNVFTPNDDGLNDCYKIAGLTKCDDIVFKVYNRWGQLQFETTNYQNCWNGRNMLNEEVTPGVYFYLLKIKKNLGNSIDQHGTITLIRE